MLTSGEEPLKSRTERKHLGVLGGYVRARILRTLKAMQRNQRRERQSGGLQTVLWPTREVYGEMGLPIWGQPSGRTRERTQLVNPSEGTAGREAQGTGPSNPICHHGCRHPPIRAHFPMTPGRTSEFFATWGSWQPLPIHPGRRVKCLFLAGPISQVTFWCTNSHPQIPAS